MSSLRGVIDFDQSEGNSLSTPDGLRTRVPDNDRTGSVAPLRFSTGTLAIHSRLYTHLTISADVDLHNREELLRALGSDAHLPVMDDRELLLAAYVKWGEGCADFLLGEFAFAIWDRRLNRLFCCRDQMGFRAFLYWRNRSRFVFAGDIESLFSHGGVPRELNRRKVAALAATMASHTDHEETFHAGVLSLPAGVWMTVEPDRVRQQRYWEPTLGEKFTRSPDEAYQCLREILFQAVECRLDRDHPVAAALSGGLDSSAVTAIAARCLEKKNRQLTAIAAVVPEERKAQFRDERDYIDEFRSWPNVRIEYVTAPGRGPFDSLRDLTRFAVAPVLSSAFYLVDECDKAALAGGARAILGGEGGEFGATSWGNRYYVELALGLRWPTLIAELSKIRSVRSRSPFRLMGSQLVEWMHPDRQGMPLALLSDNFQREYPPRKFGISRSPNQRRFQAALLRYWLRKHAVRGQTGDTLIWRTHPLLDKRVVEFCLTLPAGLNVRGGYHRCLIRKALDGILPKRIQWRTDKVPFSPDYSARFKSQLGIARDFVASIAPGDPVRSIVDVVRLEELIEQSDASGVPGPRFQIPGSIYLINFLRQFAEFRA